MASRKSKPAEPPVDTDGEASAVDAEVEARKGQLHQAVIDTTDIHDVPPPVRRGPVRPHHTRCKIVGSSVLSMGKLHEPGTIEDFPDTDVLSLPDHFERLSD